MNSVHAVQFTKLKKTFLKKSEKVPKKTYLTDLIFKGKLQADKCKIPKEALVVQHLFWKVTGSQLFRRRFRKFFGKPFLQNYFETLLVNLPSQRVLIIF